jgi:hypothetical protein
MPVRPPRSFGGRLGFGAMSPVSRGRKKKNGKKGRARRNRTGGGQAAWQDSAWPGPFTVQRPDWFDPAIEAVLTDAQALVTARGPGELEEAAARLIGARLHEVLQNGRGLRFGAWAQELIAAAADRVRDAAGTDRPWLGAWYLLHALTSIGTAPLAALAGDALADLHPLLPADCESTAPRWLSAMATVTATGQVWHMRDGYGGRIALIAGFEYPEPAQRYVYLLDFDACGIICLAHAGVFDDVDQAAAAWRSQLGEPAGATGPRPVRDADDLHCLVHWDTGELYLRGDETRAVMDNWYRAPRRADDLLAALHRHGIPVPKAHSLYRDVDIAPAVNAFTEWYAVRHGTKPDQEPTEALAAEWLQGALPGTAHVVSPHRVEFQLQLISDWIQDPVTDAVKALLPEWVCWNGEESGIPERLVEAAVAVAAGGSVVPSVGRSCPAALAAADPREPDRHGDQQQE